jgi:hypothetical protein
MAPNTITQKIIHVIEVYIKYETSDDEKECIAMYEEVCENPAEWFQSNTLYREATDLDDLGHDVWLHGWYNIDWEVVRDYMVVAYKQYLAQCKIDKEYEDNKSESSHSNSDSE